MGRWSEHRRRQLSLDGRGDGEGLAENEILELGFEYIRKFCIEKKDKEGLLLEGKT